MRRLAYVVGLLVVLAPLAHAEDARELFKRATAHYDLGRFDLAAKEYEELFESHPDQTVLLYNIAQAYRLAGINEKAIFFYNGYLRKQPTAPNRKEVEKRLRDLEHLVEEQRATQRMAPNEVAALNKEKPTHATDKRVERTPPPEKAEKAEKVAKAEKVEKVEKPAEKVEKPAEKPVEKVVPEETPPPEVYPATQPATEKEKPAATAGTPIYKRWWLWGAVGLVVVGAGVGVGVGVAASGGGGPSFQPNFPETGPGKTGALVSF